MVTVVESSRLTTLVPGRVEWMKKAHYVYDAASEREKTRLQTRDRGTRVKRDIALTAVRLKEVRSILDVGCGTGVLGFHLLELAPSAELIGLDIAAPMIEEARKNAPRDRSCRFIQGSTYDIPFEQARFDLVACQYLLQYLAEPVSALREMRRVAEPGGTAVVFEWDDRVNSSYPELPPELGTLFEAKNLLVELNGGDRSIGRKLYHHLKAAGWKDITIEIIPTVLQGPADRDFPAARLSFRQLKPGMLKAGLISEQVFEVGMQQLQSYYRDDIFSVVFFFAGFATNPA